MKGITAMTLFDQLLSCVREVRDLDQLHAFLLNEHTDKFGSSDFTLFSLALLRFERQRRQGKEDAGDIANGICDFSKMPAPTLVQTTTLSLSMVEAAVIAGEPTIMAFAFKFCELLITSLSLAHLELVNAQ